MSEPQKLSCHKKLQLSRVHHAVSLLINLLHCVRATNYSDKGSLPNFDWEFTRINSILLSLKTSDNVRFSNVFSGNWHELIHLTALNPLSANFTKWSNTLKQFKGNFPTNCLNVFDHFVGLAHKGLNFHNLF